MNDIGPKNKSCAVFEVSYNKVDKIFMVAHLFYANKSKSINKMLTQIN